MSASGQRLPKGLHKDQLGPIGKMIHGRALHDVVPIPDGLLIRCSDGLEVEIAFASKGAELKTFRLNVITEEIVMPEAWRFMRGKMMANAMTHEELFLVIMQDDHVLRFDWRTKQPEPRGVDVHVNVPPAPISTGIGSIY